MSRKITFFSPGKIALAIVFLIVLAVVVGFHTNNDILHDSGVTPENIVYVEFFRQAAAVDGAGIKTVTDEALIRELYSEIESIKKIPSPITGLLGMAGGTFVGARFYLDNGEVVEFELANGTPPKIYSNDKTYFAASYDLFDYWKQFPVEVD